MACMLLFVFVNRAINSEFSRAFCFETSIVSLTPDNNSSSVTSILILAFFQDVNSSTTERFKIKRSTEDSDWRALSHVTS